MTSNTQNGFLVFCAGIIALAIAVWGYNRYSADERVAMVPDQQTDVSTGKPADNEPQQQKPANKVEQTTEVEPKELEITGPTFDVFRVERDGSAVLAGRAVPNAKIEILSGDDVVASTTTDASGAFVSVLEKPLPPGGHELNIRSTDAKGTITLSAETGVAAIPEKSDDAFFAMVTKPGQASRITVKPSKDKSEPVAVAKAEPAIEPKADNVQLVSVDAVEVEGDTIFVAGSAPQGSSIRVYIDDRFVGEDKANEGARFLVERNFPIKLGRHSIRADMIDASGSVVARAQVPLLHDPVVAGADAPQKDNPRKAAEVSPEVEEAIVEPAKPAIPEVAEPSPSKQPLQNNAEPNPTFQKPAENLQQQTAKVEAKQSVNPQKALPEPETIAPSVEDDAEPETVLRTNETLIIRRGDNLWRISRRRYGRGIRYSVIFDANRDQIRNPHRIYPGQVLDIPEQKLN